MSEEPTRYEVSAEGQAKIEAVDAYLEQTIADGRPIEALTATKRLGEIAGDRAKEAARVATAASWSWSDVGRALGVTKQAAHEKLRTRVEREFDKSRARLEQAEEAAHDKVARRARRGREGLDSVPVAHPKIDSARQWLDKWEERKHDRISREVQKAREKVSRAEQAAQDKLGEKSSAD
jgi:hypothetical protein